MRERANELARARPLTVLVATLVVGLSLFASPASGAERIYWPNFSTATVSFANLDGSGGGTLKIDREAKVSEPNGVAIDHATGRIYWANQVGNAISYANLDGSEGGNLPTGAATVSSPQGVAIDPRGRRIYWANSSPDRISYANLDGSGGGDLATGSALVERPAGVSIDPVGKRIYWTNRLANTISYASLDGSGGGELPIGEAPIEQPFGIAVDPLDGRVFWTNLGDESIGFANLDGSGRGGFLFTGDATVESPRGIAVDGLGERVYWVNEKSVSFVDFDGQGGDLNLGTASVRGPMFPALLLSPRALKPPTIGGSESAAGPVLTCTPAEWASEFLDTSLEAPSRVGFRWALDGKEIPGATTSSLSVADSPGGEYRCLATAENRAGTSARASSRYFVRSQPPGRQRSFGRNTGVALALSPARRSSRGTVSVRVTNANPFPVRGVLSARSAARTGAGRPRAARLPARAFAVAAHGRTVVRLRLPKSLQRALARTHRLSLALAAIVVDPAGDRRSVHRVVVARQRT
jgi:DNA-binding beta-propeller fold protein YncE